MANEESTRGVGQWSTKVAKGNYFSIMSQLSWWTNQMALFKSQIAHMSLPPEPLCLIDVGIATGLTLCEVIKYLHESGHQVGVIHGYDGDAISLAEAQENIHQRFPNIQFVAHEGNLVEIHDFPKADGVIVSQVLQYLNAGEKGYAYQLTRDLIDCLKPNGFIIGGLMFNTMNTLDVLIHGGEWKEILPKIIIGKLPLSYFLHNLKIIKATNPKTYPRRDKLMEILLDGCGEKLVVQPLWGIHKLVDGKIEYTEMGFAFVGNKNIRNKKMEIS